MVIIAIVVAVDRLFLPELYPHRPGYLCRWAATRMRRKLAGIRTQRIIFMVYVITGLACGLAGVLWASRFEAAQTNTALGFELQTVAASVVGGVSISGGSGTVPGVLLGALLLGIIQNA